VGAKTICLLCIPIKIFIVFSHFNFNFLHCRLDSKNLNSHIACEIINFPEGID
jgi:hypothetical protein